MVGFMEDRVKEGTLITFEGIDGSGKSTAARALYDHLKDDLPVLLTREPGATELGSVLRTLLQSRTFDLDPKAEFLLFAADRAQHMQEIVMPALLQNKIVISDRMADSSYAYQGYGRGVDPAMIHSVNSWALQHREPDLTVYLTIDYEEARKRLNARPEHATVFEKEREAFFKRVADGFEAAFAQRSAGSAVIRIDASHNPSHVHKAVNEAVNQYLNQRKNYEQTSSSLSMDRPTSGS